MKQRKTFSEWLTNRYQVTIRNEEDFSARSTFVYTYAKILVYLVVFFLVTFSLAILAINTILGQWFDPRYTQRKNQKMLIELSAQVDSLSLQIEQKDNYINVFKTMLSGGVKADKKADSDSAKTDLSNINIDYKAPVDSALRSEFENQDFELSYYNRDNELIDVYLFKPTEGVVSQGFEPSKGHYAIDVVANPDEPVKSVSQGTVIMSSWTEDSGYIIMVQHNNNLVSVYKHNSVILKKNGSFVDAGEIIGFVGNSGELTTGPHLHFELWFNGSPVNPLNYINFN